MRMTRHNGRTRKNGEYNPEHNDRRFDLGNSEHIDPERSKLNIYGDTFNGCWTFDHMEPETELADTYEDVETLIQDVLEAAYDTAVSKKGEVLNTPGNYKTVFLYDPIA